MCTAAVSGMLKAAGAKDVDCETSGGKPTGKVTLSVPADLDLDALTKAVKGRYAATVKQ
jgi:hypothetical protein